MTKPIVIFKRSEINVSRKKVKKSATRPSDVEEWREYSSPSDAEAEAVSGAHSRPDEAALLDEYHRTKAAIPDMSDWQAHVRAAQSASATEVNKGDDPVAGLAHSLSEMHRQARRESMTPQQRHILTKASREAETVYLRAVRPWAAPAAEQIRKAEDDDALLAKSEAIRKADPNMSTFEAMRRAARAA